MMKNSNEHLLVVGAGPGIGAALARHGVRSGARVSVVARTQSTLDALLADHDGSGADIAAYTADASYAPTFAPVLERICSERGAPTLAVYNATDANPKGPASEIDPELVTSALETSITGAVVFAQSVLEPMRAASGGTILLTGGVLATRPWHPMTTLSIGKAGMRAYALCLDQELGDGVVRALTVTVGGMVAPGTPFDPDLIADAMWQAHHDGVRGEQSFPS